MNEPMMGAFAEIEPNALTREAVRVYRRYQREIVEACGLCPWAERVRLDGKVRERVLLETDLAATASSTGAIDELMLDEQAEIALLIFPRLRTTRSEFERFVSRVRDVDARRHPLGEIPFMFAAFHPNAPADETNPERLIPFLRRTPDPTIQLVRTAAVERVRSRTPQGTQFFDARSLNDEPEKVPTSLRDRIAQANFQTVQKIGVAELGRRMDDILRDRNESYRALEV